MMIRMRKFSTSWPAKIFLSILLLSFLSWGVTDFVGGVPREDVIDVGDYSMDSEEYRSLYLNAVRDTSRKLNRSLTRKEALELGVHEQLTKEVASKFALNDLSQRLDLHVSDQAFGSRARLVSGYPREEKEERERLKREQIIDALVSSGYVPSALTSMLHRFARETRSMQLMFLGESQLATQVSSAPDLTELRAFFSENEESFVLTERRSIQVLPVTTPVIAQTIDVSEGELTQIYEQMADRWSVPETRHIRRLTFGTSEEAQNAVTNLGSDVSVLEFAEQNGIAREIVDLGYITRDDLIFDNLADVAFSLSGGEISPVIETPLGFAVVEVVAIRPSVDLSFEEVRDELRDELVSEMAQARFFELYGEIEDLRATGARLSEIGTQIGIPTLELTGVDRLGRDLEGNEPPQIAGLGSILVTAFSTGVKVEADPVSAGEEGFVWFEVTDIEPSRKPEFEEVRTEILETWRRKQAREALRELSRKLLDRIENGEAIESISQSENIPVEYRSGLTRGSVGTTYDAVLIRTLFTLPVGASGSVRLAGNEPRRALFTVQGASVPVLPQADQPEIDLENTGTRMLASRALSLGLLGAFNDALLDEPGLEINEAAIARVVTPSVEDAGN